jgi:hypothetical protein
MTMIEDTAAPRIALLDVGRTDHRELSRQESMGTRMRSGLGGSGVVSAWWGGWRALGGRDPGGTSLRRALRVAIVMPSMAAFAGTIVGNPAAAAPFAVFGAFALLSLADFGGPTIPRARAYAGAAAVGAGLPAPSSPRPAPGTACSPVKPCWVAVLPGEDTPVVHGRRGSLGARPVLAEPLRE